jgi:tetratricopeptide (TPR) repeat protein
MVVNMRAIVAAGMGNAAMLLYLRAASLSSMTDTVSVGADPVQIRGSQMQRSLELFQSALTMDPNDSRLQWGQMRVALKTGSPSQSQTATTTVEAQLRSNPLFYQDVLLSLSHAGDHDAVTTTYESISPPYLTDVMRDVVAYAYLQVGRKEALESAVQLRPDDLYINYQLWKRAVDEGNSELVDLYRTRLEHFGLSSILPRDRRLLEYAVLSIPNLYIDGVWSREQLLNVVALLAWQHPDSPEVAFLTKRLSNLFPQEPDWLFYSAEISHRNGQLDTAEALYRQVVLLDRSFLPAYLRLASLLESQIEMTRESPELRGAISAYQQYYALGGDDLLGAVRLDALCMALTSSGIQDQLCSDRATMEHYATRLGPQGEQSAPFLLDSHSDVELTSMVPALVGVNADQVQVGPNLIENGGFEDWVGQGLPGMAGVKSRPSWWNWTEMFGREPFSPGLFFGGYDELDPFEGKRVARVDSQWLDRQSHLESPRAGYWHFDEGTRGLRRLELPSDTAYVLSFVYRTRQVPDSRTTAWVASADQPGSLWFGNDPLLPATDGAWYRFAGIGWNHSDSTAVLQPLLRLYATGSVDFDDVELRPIYYSGLKPLGEDVQLFVIRGGGTR